MKGRFRFFAFLALALLFLIPIARRYDPHTGLTRMIEFQKTAVPPAHPALQNIPHAVLLEGYDGQFYAQLALDPTLRDPDVGRALDAPAYRARRILVPAIGFVLGLGKPALILARYPWINILFWLALAFVLVRRLSPQATARHWAVLIAILFSAGALESVRLALTDLPASCLLLFAALLPAQGASSLILQAFACLARETSLLGAVALACGREITSSWPKRIGLFAMALLPFAAWLAYVTHRYGWQSGASGNIAFPFSALMQKVIWSFTPNGSFSAYREHLFALATVIGLSAQAAFLALHRRPDQPLWRIGIAFALLFPFLGPPVWENHLAACRALLPLTIAFNLMLAETPSRHFWGWFAVGNFFSLYELQKFYTVHPLG